MSLDQNLFTLTLTPNPSFPAGTVVDLTDSAGTIHYRKRRIASQQQQVYRIEISGTNSNVFHGQDRSRRRYRSTLRGVVGERDCPQRDDQTQDLGALQSLQRRRAQVHRHAHLSMVFQMGDVCRPLFLSHESGRRCYSFPIADTNSNGNAKNALSFESRIHPCSSRSQKNRLVGFGRRRSRSWIITLIGTSLSCPCFISLASSLTWL